MEDVTIDEPHHDIKAVFFDIDGTLTSFVTHTVPASTVEAIHRLQAGGIKVFICTGRAPSQMNVVLDTMPVTFDGIVAFNGQYCFDNTGFFASQAIDTGDIRIIINWLAAHPEVVCNFGEKDYVYFNHSNDRLQATWKKLGKTAPTRYFDDPMPRAITHETFQISPFIAAEQEAELVGLCSNIRGVRWHPDFTDLIPADGGKPRGIQRFMKHYGIAREQTMAFGDGGNDTDMLAFAGIGVAMGNATAEPKAAADYITDDVDHDGVLNALLHWGVLKD
ncbi:Cof-type HAD-IIB family hydrolase [Bifidobacterium olomucense]|uniref:COF family hydrolase n=1 Tax=Bifidobacterium olomucense TaxID=2675324 RepID=A0A7Y0EXG6_9BIFI|nr:Cof-type HAD-IIB family hydrolase [Bifidobacterium sp. DSM 109959]NMM98217.1 COF family hydrolase [Bifidobacterium sp. DSM 109959]